MRSKRVALFAIFESLTQIVRSLLSIYVRRVFILTLGDELLGLNGLFSSVVSFLSLAELGLNATVAACLYESLAHKDKKNVAAYMYLVKKVYMFIGIFILLAGVAVLPVVFQLINGGYSQSVVVVGYILHLLATAASYFFSYRCVFLYANQEGYIVSRANLILYTTSLVCQLIVLFCLKSYIGFLVCTIIQNMVFGLGMTHYVNRKYKDLLAYNSKPILEQTEKAKFILKFKSMIIYRVSEYLIQGADISIISVLIGTVVVGYYNNYNLILNMCWAIFIAVSNGAVAGIGNLIYTEKEKAADTLFQLLFSQHILFCVSVTGIFQLSSLFVTIFFGSSSILPLDFVLWLSICYYVRGIMYSVETFRMGSGNYENDRWQQLGIALLNILISIVGCIIWGIKGVVIGTVVCYFVRGMWLTPRQLFGGIIESGYKIKYYGRISIYALTTIGINTVIRLLMDNLVFPNMIVQFILEGIVCVVIVVLVNFILFYRFKEFSYFLNLMKLFGKGRREK